LKKIGDLLNDQLIFLNVSLDAGTADTFAKIKGIDCFDKVIKNLEKYAAVGNIQLKYILLEGINDNKNDIDDFVAIAERINANVQISRDNRKSFTRMSERGYSAILRLTRQCTAQSVQYFMIKDYFVMYIDRLKREGLLI
jgi:molybdenum cofactor biosynthesis enzyme MoaA